MSTNVSNTNEQLVGLAARSPEGLIGYVPPPQGRPDTGTNEIIGFEAEGVLVDRAAARWLVALAAAAAGVAVGLLLAVVLIPEQPDRILVPVPEPAPSMHVDPDDGVQA